MGRRACAGPAVRSVSRLATSAIIALLELHTGLLVGDGEAPTGDLDGRPYLVVNVMSGMVTGPLSHDFRWAKHVVQVRSVGLTREGAEWGLDLARETALNESLTVAGATVAHVDLEVTNVLYRDDDDYGASRWVAADRYAFHLDTGA